MNVLGIIAEYNPFHNGHKLQIEKLKKETNSDFCIVAMSGNFVQRGTPAILDKYTRCQMALSAGADLVIEIPTIFACSSAEYFAQSGVRTLLNTGVITHIGFGSECENISILKEIASILSDFSNVAEESNEDKFDSKINFAVAREIFIMNKFNFSKFNITKDELHSILNSSNNILAIEYIKCLIQSNSSVTPVALKRVGNDYNDEEITSSLASATSIRKLLNASNYCSSMLVETMPASSFHLIEENFDALVFDNDISQILLYRLLQVYHSRDSKTIFSVFADCTNDLSNKICNNLYNYESFDQFRLALKSKDITYSRISRVLLHILLDIRKEDYSLGIALNYSPYLRVLGFRKDSSKIFSFIKQNGAVPMITKMANSRKELSNDAFKILSKDIFAGDIYSQLSKKGEPISKNEFTQQIVII